MALDETIDYDKEQTPKLHTLQQAGINPFPAFHDERERTAIATVLDDHTSFKHFLKEGDNEQYPYTIMGRIIARRGQGGVFFFDVEDAPGYVRDERMQVMVKRDIAPDVYELADLLDIGDFIRVTGVLYLPPRKELTIHAMSMELLSKTVQSIPDKKKSAKGVADPEVRFRHRELDLLGNPHVRKLFVQRAAIVREVRNYLNAAGYLEVETPILQPLAGGSESRPFRTHYHSLDRDMVLSVSPELYINRVLIGGFERVYSLTRSFRNEGISRRHNPEFTELEFMCAYADNHTLAQRVEMLIATVTTKALKIGHITVRGERVDLQLPWRRYTLDELLQKHTGKRLVEFTADEAMEIYTKEIEPTLIQPTFVFNFPIEAFPICRQIQHEPHLADHFDGVIGGIEVVSADMELNDPVDQRRRFTEQAKNTGGDAPAPHDAEYIRALEHGLPPTAGAAIGIDRLVMLLTEQETIREVIPFPMLKSVS
jgi:lysyl-tRNA synthetase class 2